MESIYNHFDFYTNIKVQKKTYQIRRMTVKMYINFFVNFRAWKLLYDKKALNELISDCVINRVSEFAHKILLADEIMRSMEKTDINVSKNKESKKIENKNWVSELIAFFAFHCGWKKEETLSLFLDEVKELIEKINSIVLNKDNTFQDRVFSAFYYARNKPEKYHDEVVNVRNSTNKNTDELEKIRAINKAFMSKHYGGSDAVQ